MKPEVFELLLEFHQGLIRTKSGDEAISGAKSILVDGKTSRGISRGGKQLAANLEKRGQDLLLFKQGSWEQKAKIYSRAYKKKPADGVFKALELVFLGVGIGGASSTHCVNHESVKSLKPRFERYINFAERLDKLL